MNNRSLWRPLDAAHLGNPYPMYRELRAADPVYLAQTGEYIVSRYDDIKEILKSSVFESGNRLAWMKRGIQYMDNKEEDFRAILQAMNSFVLMLNGEQHQRIRNFVIRTWSDREVDSLIRRNATLLLDGLRGRSEIDFVTEYAQPLPVLTISSILGISVTNTQQLIDLGIAMTKALDLYLTLKDLVHLNRAAADFVSLFRDQIRYKSTHPDGGLLSRMIQYNKAEAFGLSEEELISIAIFLFTAGEETSASLISNSLHNLLIHPDQMALVREHPELTESAIEEVLRYDSVVHLLGRISQKKFNLRDKLIPTGATMTLVIASANRDESVFENADQFIITRKPNRHLSFGSGRHFCLGDWLGRSQSRIAIEAFLDRFPTIELPPQQLSWYPNIAVRRLNTLRITVRED